MKSKLKVEIDEFKYQDDSENLLKNIKILLEEGDILWIQGRVGCGKTSLLKLLAGIIPNFEGGKLKGKISLDGTYIGEKTFSETSFCFQHPDNQFLFDTVRKQFYGENSKILDYCKEIGFYSILEKSVMDLSCGQRKFVALMSTLFKKRKLYIFDEPLDLLDDEIKGIVLKRIEKVSKNSIVIISSHDTGVESIANKVLFYKEDGKWILVERKLFKKNEKKHLYLLPKKNSSKDIFKSGNLKYKYKGNSEIIQIPPLKIGNNEILGIVGNNGTGKTTLLKLLTESVCPYEGQIEIRSFNRFGFLSQNVNRQLFASSVIEELFLGLEQISKQKKIYGKWLLKELDLEKVQSSHPVFLSGGQKQKLLFASLLIHDPEIIFLDELFTNLDPYSISVIFSLLKKYRQRNNLSVIFTDQQVCLLIKICDRIIFMQDSDKSFDDGKE